MSADHELASLLGRWHQWRHHWSHEKGYARARLLAPSGPADDDDFEAMMMEAMESEIALMPREYQLALQHVARAECLGVEVLTVRALANHERRQTAIAQAIAQLRHRLSQAGVLC